MVLVPDESLSHSMDYLSLDGGRSIAKAAYLTDDLIAIMDDLYEQIYKALKDGIIDLSPDKKACTYCRFKTICHFDGVKNDKRQISSEIKMRKFEDELQWITKNSHRNKGN